MLPVDSGNFLGPDFCKGTRVSFEITKGSVLFFYWENKTYELKRFTKDFYLFFNYNECRRGGEW